MIRGCRDAGAILATLAFATVALAGAENGRVEGRLADPQGRPVSGAKLRLIPDRDAKGAESASDPDGGFVFSGLAGGTYRLVASAPGLVELTRTVTVMDGTTSEVSLQFDRLASSHESITVTADVKDLDIQNPDPAQRILIREEILDANPGRPGAPVSIPGLPIETASSGIKAPQYFAPGVAGDHGEPIAQFIQVGSYLMPNNLSANAHGNGYADPNIMVPAIIESVQTDGGAFNVREGDHSVDLAAIYAIRPSMLRR
jgi:hypothetical protein